MNDLDKYLRQIESDQQTLSKINNILSNNWQDKKADEHKDKYLYPLDNIIQSFVQNFQLSVNAIDKLYRQLQEMSFNLYKENESCASYINKKDGHVAPQSKLGLANQRDTKQIPDLCKIEGIQHKTLGYIHSSGRIESYNHTLQGFITENGRVETPTHALKGYITPEGKFEDRRHRTLGYITETGRIEDVKHNILGYITDNGRVETPNHSLIAYYYGYNKSVAAALFFFFK